MIALAFARLMNVPPDWPVEIRIASEQVVQAVTAYPELVGGNGELDTEFIRSFAGEGLCKLGAEGVCAAAFRATPQWPSGVGIAIKIADGLGNRARDVVLAECVAQLELGRPEQREAFRRRVAQETNNQRGEIVGDICAGFELRFNF